MARKLPHIPDPKVPYPTTKGEAIRLIESVFIEQDWDIGQVNYFINSLDLPDDWRKFEIDNLKKVLAEMIRLRLVLIK